MKTRQNAVTKDRVGAAAVEFAVVAPVFLLLVFGMIDFGRALMMSQVVQNAAREGARLAATDGATDQDVENLVYSYLEESLGIPDSEITLTISVSAGPGNTSPSGLADASPGDQCTVQVLVPYNQVAVFKSDYFSGAKLRGYASMRREW